MIKTYTINTQKVISETLDNETIIINLETGCYYSMNPSGTALWYMILGNKPFDTEKNTQDILNFINLLQEEDLVFETQQDTTLFSLEDFKDIHDPKFDKYTDMQEMLLADPVHDVDTAGWPKLKIEN